MSNRLTAGAFVLGGLLILLVSLLANVLGQLPAAAGLGIGHDPGFGSQQALGTIVGLVVLLVGVWLWRQGAEPQSRSVRYAIAAFAVAVVFGGPIYVLAKGGLQESATVEACVEVETVPRSAEGTGQKRVNYGVRIANTGQVAVYMDSVVLIALRDSVGGPLFGVGSWLSQSEVVGIEGMTLWKQVDSVTIRPDTPGTWSVNTGSELATMRSIIVPVEQLSSLYWFLGIVFLRHRDTGRPIVRNSAADWIDNFRQECP